MLRATRQNRAVLNNSRNLLSTVKRNFSSEVALTGSCASRPTGPTTRVGVSDFLRQKEAALQEANKGYLDMLDDQPSRAAYFGKLIHPEEGDHSEILKVKSQIQKLLE